MPDINGARTLSAAHDDAGSGGILGHLRSTTTTTATTNTSANGTVALSRPLAVLVVVASFSANCSRRDFNNDRKSTVEQHTSPSGSATDRLAIVVSVGKRTPSPSGKYQAELIVVDKEVPANRQMLRVRIVPTASETPAFESGTMFATWFPLRVQWDTADRLWANSSDVGSRVWALHEGNWTEFLWQSDGPKVPDANRVVWDAQLNRNVFILGIEPPP